MKLIKRKRRARGFTLLEVIIGLIILSVMSAMLVTFMGSSVVQSANPVILAQNGAYVNQIMENMTADYRYLLATDTTASPLNTFRGRVASGYYCSDVNNPCTVVENAYISFPSGSSVTEGASVDNKILKVTINYRDLTLTALFTE